MRFSASKMLQLFFAGAMIFTLSSCHNMEDDARMKPYEKSGFFKDGMSARPPVEGTVARGQLHQDDHLYTGKINGRFVKSFPFKITEQTLRMGQEKFNIYCAVCHNQTGTGDGMIVRRGFKQPPSYYEQRLRDIPEGYLFEVLTYGFGNMPRFSPELSAEERWAVIAYIRTLQLSRSVSLDQLQPEEKELLLNPPKIEKKQEAHG